jgi:hypothetical protein
MRERLVRTATSAPMDIVHGAHQHRLVRAVLRSQKVSGALLVKNLLLQQLVRPWCPLLHQA